MKKHFIIGTLAAAVAALALTVLSASSMATVYHYEDGTTYDTRTNCITDTSDGSYYNVDTGERYNGWTGEYSDCYGHKYRRLNDNEPYSACATLSDAEALAGFEFGRETDITGMTKSYAVIDGNTIQTRYHSKDNDIVIRKTSGSIEYSGSAYSSTMTETFGGYADVILCGNNQGYFYAVWTVNGYSYSIKSKTALSMSQMDDIIRELM